NIILHLVVRRSLRILTVISILQLAVVHFNKILQAMRIRLLGINRFFGTQVEVAAQHSDINPFTRTWLGMIILPSVIEPCLPILTENLMQPWAALQWKKTPREESTRHSAGVR